MFWGPHHSLTSSYKKVHKAGRVVGLVKRHSPTENSEIIQRKATHLRHTTSDRKFCQSSHVAYAKPTAGIRGMLPYEPEAATLTPRRSRKGSSKVRTGTCYHDLLSLSHRLNGSLISHPISWSSPLPLPLLTEFSRVHHLQVRIDRCSRLPSVVMR
jgi:hypothetical protein